MSRVTSTAPWLGMEEFEARDLPAHFGLTLPALHGIHAVTGELPAGLLRAIENGAPGLTRGLTTPSGVTPPGLANGPGTPVVTPPVQGGGPVVDPPTIPGGTDTPPVVTGPIGSDPTGPVAGPFPVTETSPTVGTAPAAGTTTAPASKPTAGGATVAATATAVAAFAADTAATTTTAAFFPPTTAVGPLAGTPTDTIPGGVAARSSSVAAFQNEAPPAAAYGLVPAPLLFAVPVDPATAAVTPPAEELVLPAEGTPAAPVVPATEQPAAAAATAEAVAAPLAEEEAAGLPYWGWASAIAAVAAGGYWAARRHRLVRRLAAYLRQPVLPVRA